MTYWTEKILAMLQSRRFQLLIVGILVIFFQDVLGMTEEQSSTVAQMIMAWIVGDSLLNTTNPRLTAMRERLSWREGGTK